MKYFWSITFATLLFLGFSPLTQAQGCICSTDSYNCDDFADRSSAEACFGYCNSSGAGDIHRLDQDNDGQICESTTSFNGTVSVLPSGSEPTPVPLSLPNDPAPNQPTPIPAEPESVPEEMPQSGGVTAVHHAWIGVFGIIFLAGLLTEGVRKVKGSSGNL